MALFVYEGQIRLEVEKNTTEKHLCTFSIWNIVWVVFGQLGDFSTLLAIILRQWQQSVLDKIELRLNWFKLFSNSFWGGSDKNKMILQKIPNNIFLIIHFYYPSNSPPTAFLLVTIWYFCKLSTSNLFTSLLKSEVWSWLEI